MYLGKIVEMGSKESVLMNLYIHIRKL